MQHMKHTATDLTYNVNVYQHTRMNYHNVVQHYPYKTPLHTKQNILTFLLKFSFHHIYFIINAWWSDVNVICLFAWMQQYDKQPRGLMWRSSFSSFRLQTHRDKRCLLRGGLLTEAPPPAYLPRASQTPNPAVRLRLTCTQKPDVAHLG